jgi:glutamine synthetase
MEALSREAVAMLKLMGYNDVDRVTATIGSEQEYFLIDKELYKERKDLLYTGRTLFGAPAPKGQEMEDHYFGVLKPRVAAYMHDLETELWKLGVPVKTKHNEVAPSQHELAPVYETANIAVDHNQLTMEVMKKVADRHNLACLLHEKPFEGINGSGKHNNWSVCTDTGMNLLDPGKNPGENLPFLVFVMAVIAAVDDYAPILRLSVASAGNDHRLGGNEAPPAIISIFVGDELAEVLKGVEQGAAYKGAGKVQMGMGATVLPHFTKDNTDRNRTSPFAFTGNKFEFRMVGSSNSIACANIMLNTAVAEALCQMADELEKADDFDSCLQELIKRTIREHKRIVFNGNGYDDSWVKEAVEKRGLLNLRTTPEAMARLLDEKNIRVLTKHTVMSEAEIRSRYEIMMENYCKTDMIEARTMVRMAKKDILPAIDSYMKELADVITAKQSVSPELACGHESKKLKKLSALADLIDERSDALDAMASETEKVSDITCQGEKIWKDLLPDMAALRQVCDETETLVGRKYWPFPTYGDLLFSVK